jgi:hypothetical protein
MPEPLQAPGMALVLACVARRSTPQVSQSTKMFEAIQKISVRSGNSEKIHH